MPAEVKRRGRSVSPHGSSLFARLGGAIGTVWKAVAVAEVSAEVVRGLRDHKSTTATLEPEPRTHPFTPEMHFPPRPAPDWSDPSPSEIPKPTYAPATLAFGLMLAAAGVVTSFWVSLAGLIMFVLGLANWIGELFHEHRR